MTDGGLVKQPDASGVLEVKHTEVGFCELWTVGSFLGAATVHLETETGIKYHGV